MLPDHEQVGLLIPSLNVELGEEMDDELHRFAPTLVVWPEGRPADAPPWPGGARPRDYHPRAVSLFTDVARLRNPYRMAAFGILWGWWIRLAAAK